MNRAQCSGLTYIAATDYGALAANPRCCTAYCETAIAEFLVSRLRCFFLYLVRFITQCKLLTYEYKPFLRSLYIPITRGRSGSFAELIERFFFGGGCF